MIVIYDITAGKLTFRAGSLAFTLLHSATKFVTLRLRMDWATDRNNGSADRILASHAENQNKKMFPKGLW